MSSRIWCSFEACSALSCDSRVLREPMVKRKNRNRFKGRQFTTEIIPWAVRWHLQFLIWSCINIPCCFPIEACKRTIRPSFGRFRLALPNWTSVFVCISV